MCLCGEDCCVRNGDHVSAVFRFGVEASPVDLHGAVLDNRTTESKGDQGYDLGPSNCIVPGNYQCRYKCQKGQTDYAAALIHVKQLAMPMNLAQ